MWTREQIKTRAKSALIGSYWKAFLVSLIVGITEYSRSGSSANSGIDTYRNGSMNFRSMNMDGVQKLVPFFIPIATAVTLIGLLFILFRVFLGYSLEVGGRRYFIKAAEEDADLENVLYSFKEDRYINIIKTMLYKNVLLVLWSLLFIIPGIIKSYSYRMVPYILAENPQIGYKRAIEISNSMTSDQKFKIWVLDISFLGWYLLGIMAFFIGVLFVKPYEDATEAELYLILKKRAISNGSCSAEELTMAKTL